MAFIRPSCGAMEAGSVSRRCSAILAIGILLIGVPAFHASAQTNDAVREKVTLEGTHADMQFLAGRTVHVRATVTDDVFAAGRDVTFEDATVANAIVAGYDVEQRGGSAADMIAAAANFRLSGTIKDDLVAAARSMRISSDGNIGGDARLAAETIDVEGRIGGSMRAAARRISISGAIDGKVDLLAERIVIAAGARISGDLIYRSRNEPEIADGAKIGGEVRRVEVDVPDTPAFAGAVLGIGFLIALFWILAVLVIVAVFQVAFSNFTSASTERLEAHPWSNLGRGVAVHILAVVLAGLLFGSVIGIPIGAALVFSVACIWLMGLVTISAWIGLFVRRKLRRPFDIQPIGRVGWTLIGTVILGLVTLVPFLGAVVVGLAIAAGFGAAAAELWTRFRSA